MRVLEGLLAGGPKCQGTPSSSFSFSVPFQINGFLSVFVNVLPEQQGTPSSYKSRDVRFLNLRRKLNSHLPVMNSLTIRLPALNLMTEF